MPSSSYPSRMHRKNFGGAGAEKVKRMTGGTKQPPMPQAPNVDSSMGTTLPKSEIGAKPEIQNRGAITDARTGRSTAN